ncbi:MAG: hypothetical protein JGK17_10715 [Microcoleus sp. PH2017_10_PVI_O_A]|uniref:hypothetical protein n=1 Tax=unclassified Microcoleus TaxID=2642155 RepID=UPI001E0A7778|nr:MULTISPECIES: hypothetical protein [unclassified Microcoleus]MCC3406045.1 hypothetical protein [Microcoleus sp. PH2017_10_PVI_O_A]MCC3460208.1 hypothetical protein [Microcoleus sp. PH2017_11_PCY_U_A]MCC3529988.1 hypothetical protein [Microcoleus sp. PH2017_21_RUC_O_A]
MPAIAQREGDKGRGAEDLALFPRPLKMNKPMGDSQGKLTIKNYQAVLLFDFTL